MEETRDAEVEDLQLIGVLRGQVQVRRLDVAMDDAAFVEHRERLGGAHADVQALVQREARALETLAEIFALEPLHREVRPAALRETVGDVADDPRMAHLGEELGLIRSEELLGRQRISLSGWATTSLSATAFITRPRASKSSAVARSTT